MAAVALAYVGASIGASIGGTILGISAATIGGTIGIMVGSYIDSAYLFPALFGGGGASSSTTVYGPRLGQTNLVPITEYGVSIPRMYGTARVPGQLIWASQVRERVTESIGTSTTKVKRGKSSSTVRSEIRRVDYKYYADFAVLLCQGPIEEVGAIYLAGKLATPEFVSEHVKVYLGTESQTPDTDIQADVGAALAPAYRGRAYLVFVDVPLELFGNRIPEVSAVVRAAPSTLSAVVDDVMRAAGVPSSRVHVDPLPDVGMLGYLVNVSAARAIIEELQRVAYFTVSETDGAITVRQGAFD